jgi:hypothetical protein
MKYTGRLENDFTARGYLGDGLEFFPGLLRVPRVLVRVPPRVWSHCRFRNSEADSVRESSMKWMSVSTKRQCDRALGPPQRQLAVCLLDLVGA